MMPLRLMISLLYLGAATAAFFELTSSRLAVGAMAAVTVLSALTRLFMTKSITLTLGWEAGFIVVIVSEALQTQVAAVVDYPAEAYRVAVQLLLLGHALVVVAADAVQVDGSPGWRSDRGGRLSGVRMPALAPLIVAVVSSVHLVPKALSVLQDGRVAIFGESGPWDALLTSAGMVAPALIAARFRHTSKRPLALSYLAASPILLAQMATGTRFVVLFALLGPLLVVLGPRLDNRRSLAAYGYAAATLIVASSAMLLYRTGGVGDYQGLNIGQIEFSNEAVVLNSARLVHYFESNVHLLGASAGSAFIFGVPRSLWPEKPSLIGHWFPRAYGLEGFGDAHSVSLGYLGDGYADFGAVGVVLYCLLLGCLLGFGQRFCDQAYAAGSDAERAFAAILFPAAIFAVRSPVTSMINVVGVAVVVIGVALALSVLRASRATKGAAEFSGGAL